MITSMEVVDKQCRLNNIVNKLNESRMLKDREYTNLIRELAYEEDLKFIKPIDQGDFEMTSVMFNKLEEDNHTMHQGLTDTFLNKEEPMKEMGPPKQEVAGQMPPTGAPIETWPNDLKMEDLHIQKPKPLCSHAHSHMSF